jgi:hypothetical protein
MRQLAYFFRRTGAKVVAGGSVCTMFPEFAAQYFDAVCAGGVDSVRQVVADFEAGKLQRIYRSPIMHISSYAVDYSLLALSGISPSVHLMESSRGCSFRCSFCVIPQEVGGHVKYSLSHLSAAIDNALATSPFFSFRRWYPTIIFLDNNFSDDREYMLQVCELMRKHPKIRGWAALVTQNIMHDRELIKYMADAKCMTLFFGLESFDQVLLKKYKKKQNLGRSYNIIDDIAFAESNGIGIGYGYLFDPRLQTVQEMDRQIRMIGEHPALPMPVYLSVVAPLAGTEGFWNDLASRQLRPNLRLRDLDGETVAYSNLADNTDAIVAFLEKLFRRPWMIVSRFSILMKTLRRIVRSGSYDPIHWYIIAAANLHCFVWSSTSPSEGANLSCRQRNARSPIRGIPGRYLTGGLQALFRASCAHRRSRRPDRLAHGLRPPVVETIRRPSKWMLIARLRTHRPLRDRRLLARQSSSSFLNEACARANQAAQSTIELRIKRYRRGGHHHVTHCAGPSGPPF